MSKPTTKEASNIVVGFIAAYDLELIQFSLPQVYPYADKIIIAIDVERKSYTAKKHLLNEETFDWISAYDCDQKVEWYEDAFFTDGLQPQEVELRMRQKLLDKMMPAKWYIQLDSDEYFLDFEKFTYFIQSLDLAGETLVSCKLKTIFKKTEEGFLTIGGKSERCFVASNRPYYTKPRFSSTASIIESEFYMIHQSWARSEQQVQLKLHNWGHTNDFDINGFFKFWKNCSKKNYKSARHFHPLHEPIWPYLEYIAAADITELIEFYRTHSIKEEGTPPLPLWNRITKRLRTILPK